MAGHEKKVLLFIVEGESDEVSFESVLDSFFESCDVHVAVMHGDVTVQDFPNPGEIKGLLYEQVMVFCCREKIRLNDIRQIIHLVDTDGVFVPDSCVLQQSAGLPLFYDENAVHAPDPFFIKKRNDAKAAVLRNLCSMTKLASIEYRVYFLSRTLEHVLHNRIENLTDREKADLSNRFEDRYADDFDGFLAFIADRIFAVPGDYKATWEFIRQGTNSLKRYSNVHLLFEKT
jgi:hypothetical protein